MGDECKELLSEFTELRMEVEVQEMLECPVHATWPKDLKKVVRLYNSKGRAMNTYEALESLPDFLAQGAVEAIERMIGVDRETAQQLIVTAVQELPGPD